MIQVKAPHAPTPRSAGQRVRDALAVDPKDAAALLGLGAGLLACVVWSWTWLLIVLDFGPPLNPFVIPIAFGALGVIGGRVVASHPRVGGWLMVIAAVGLLSLDFIALPVIGLLQWRTSWPDLLLAGILAAILLIAGVLAPFSVPEPTQRPELKRSVA